MCADRGGANDRRGMLAAPGFVREENGYIYASHSSFWCNLLRGGATCHREREAAHPSSPFSSFQLPLLLFLFSFLFFRHIGAIYGLVQEGGEIEGRGGGGGSDKSLVVKRGDHGGGERREGEGVQSFARPKVFHPWNRIYVYIFFDGGGNSWDSMIWMELSSTWDKPGPVFFNMEMLVSNFSQKF